MPSVAVLGLGAMGGTLAARLVECGTEVHGYDISDAAIKRLQDNGGRASTRLEVALAGKDIVISNLPNDEILWSVVQGGLKDQLRPEQSFVETSTILPQTMVKIAAELDGKVREVVDAPVSGGPPEAQVGKLSILVGCDSDVSQSTLGVLSQLGTVHVLGKVGTGKSLKLVNNMISLSNTAIAMEALQLGKSLGLDYQTMYDVLTKSGGASTMLSKRGSYVIDDDFSARFEVSLAEKDTRLALELAHKQRFPTPLLANVHQRYEAAVAAGLSKEDICALIKLYKN